MDTRSLMALPLAGAVGLAAAAPGTTTDPVDDGHRLLFRQAQGRQLPEADQRAVYMRLNLVMSADGTGLAFKDMECPAFQFDAVEVQDLNGDGRNEVIVRGGNTCTSGGDGSSVWLLTQSAQGGWETHLGFPAGGYRILAVKHQGYPDIQFGGMGWCESVWRWDGTTYQHFRNVPTQAGGCDHLR